MIEPLSFNPDDRVFIMRRDFVRICDGNHAAAAVLSQMYFWYKVKADHVTQAYVANALHEKASPGSGVQDTELWVYKKHKETQEELFGTFGMNAIGAAYKFLLAKGFLNHRENPIFKFDNTLQYRFNVANVQAALRCIGNESELYSHKDRNFKNKAGDFSGKVADVIPKEPDFDAKVTIPDMTPKEDYQDMTIEEEESTPASPPPSSPSSKKEKVASDDEKAKELLRAFRAVRYPNDKPWLESEWQKYALSVRNLVKDGVTPEEYQAATAKALREWPKREMVNPRSIAAHISSLLEKKTTGRTMAEEFKAKSDAMNAIVAELYGTPARETHIAETFDPRGNTNGAR